MLITGQCAGDPCRTGSGYSHIDTQRNGGSKNKRLAKSGEILVFWSGGIFRNKMVNAISY